jgi:hypothetical protein
MKTIRRILSILLIWLFLFIGVATTTKEHIIKSRIEDLERRAMLLEEKMNKYENYLSKIQDSHPPSSFPPLKNNEPNNQIDEK